MLRIVVCVFFGGGGGSELGATLSVLPIPAVLPSPHFLSLRVCVSACRCRRRCRPTFPHTCAPIHTYPHLKQPAMMRKCLALPMLPTWFMSQNRAAISSLEYSWTGQPLVTRDHSTWGTKGGVDGGEGHPISSLEYSWAGQPLVTRDHSTWRRDDRKEGGKAPKGVREGGGGQYTRDKGRGQEGPTPPSE